MYRLCLGFKTLQVHDIVADPIGRYDMILSRHTLQVIVSFIMFLFWWFLLLLCFVRLNFLLILVLQQHLKTGDVERVLANFAKSGSTFLLTTNFPTAKVRRQCVCDLNQTHKKTEMIRKICSFSSHLISVDCLFLQKNTDLSEDTQYRYRPVNLLLEPYFLPRPVRS